MTHNQSELEQLLDYLYEKGYNSGDGMSKYPKDVAILETQAKIERYITANYTPNSEVEKQVPEAIGGHVRETYYNYDCPNNLHLFALLGDTETCVYCYVKDNPPTKGATK